MAAPILPKTLQDNISLSALVVMPTVCARCDQAGTHPVHRMIPWTTQSVTLRLCHEHRRADQAVNAAVAISVVLGVATLAIGGLFSAHPVQLFGLFVAGAAVAALYLRPGARVSRGKDGTIALSGVSREFRRQAGVAAHPAGGARSPLLTDWLGWEN